LSHITSIRRFINRYGYLLILAGWGLTFSYLFQYYWSYTSAPEQVKRTLQRAIQTREKKFETVFEDKNLLAGLKNGTYSRSKFEELYGKDYFIFLATENDGSYEVRFWNTQIIVPANELWRRADGVWFERLINGYYTVSKKTVQLKDSSVVYVMALIPVKWNYFVTTRYLNNDFAYLKNIENYYTLSDLSPTPLAIRSTDGTILFWLKQQTNLPRPLSTVTVLLRLLAVFFLLLFVHRAAGKLAQNTSFARGFGFLTVIVISLRVLTYYFPVPLNFRQFELFNPAIYGSSNVLKSLGDLLINSSLLLWFLLFVRNFGRGRNIFIIKKLHPAAGTAFSAILLFTATFLCGYIARSLVADSKISFNVTNFFSLTAYSFVGFCVLGIVALNYYLLLSWLMPALQFYSKRNIFIQLTVIALAAFSYLSFNISSVHVSFQLYLLGWLMIITIIFHSRKPGFGFLPSGGKTLFWLFFFSASLTALLFSENSKKEWEDRKRLAEKLSMQTDPAAESLLNLASNNFRNEFLGRNFYRFTTSGANQYLKDSLLSENFRGYLNKFESRIFTFNGAEQPLFNEDSTSFNTLNAIYNLQSKPTTVGAWRYYEGSFDKFYYLTKKEVTDTSLKAVAGYMFIVSRPRRYSDEKFYPELFSKTFNALPENTPSYAYALYKNNELVSSFNDYPFKIHITEKDVKPLAYQRLKRNDYSELWYADSKDRTVVISKQQNQALENITLFSVLFCVFLLLLGIYRFSEMIMHYRLKLNAWKLGMMFTFRSQVHTTIIAISIFSFLVIGVSTIIFFINRHNRTNKERLSRTIQIMKGEVETALREHTVFDDMLKLYDDVTSAELQNKISRISEIHGVDVNIYDPGGNLRLSSQPYYYNKGLLSRKAEPGAFFKLSKDLVVQAIETERVGSQSYMSIYVPVRDEGGQTYAYINIPYFTSQNELKQEISNFLVTFIILNAFIFLVAGIIAFFVTSRITNSFALISDKLKQVKLGKANEEIVWEREDEIGELIREYNRMVLKLEESAALLARSEREGAWREMARQVAHEIKNPLTPMKLSIQYLQKAIDNNSTDAKQIAQNVAKTLVEQIDYLSNIASDFSSFANIGNPRTEKVNLQDSLKAVVDLFAINDAPDAVHLHANGSPVFVLADKTQLNRLFTNLIRNGIESVPSNRKAEININVFHNAKEALVEVKDNGDGITPELQDKIFYPNFTTKSSGTGLGLAMCKSIVEQMKGDIWFETEQQQGTRFYIKLPVVQNQL
jgi:signal transduction histidine kinase